MKGVTSLTINPQPPQEQADRLAALGESVLASFEIVREQAGSLDDALRAIAAIARAGRDTPKVRRILREIVDDQTRLAKTARE